MVLGGNGDTYYEFLPDIETIAPRASEKDGWVAYKRHSQVPILRQLADIVTSLPSYRRAATEQRPYSETDIPALFYAIAGEAGDPEDVAQRLDIQTFYAKSSDCPAVFDLLESLLRLEMKTPQFPDINGAHGAPSPPDSPTYRIEIRGYGGFLRYDPVSGHELPNWADSIEPALSKCWRQIDEKPPTP